MIRSPAASKVLKNDLTPTLLLTTLFSAGLLATVAVLTALASI